MTVDGTRYAGLLTHPLILANNAHPAEPSFVFRGRMIQKRLLCTPMAPPPANALTDFERLPLPAQPIARDVANTIESNPTCGGCHRMLDPPGLAFEHFDAIGQFRERYPSGRAIDTSGTLVGIGADTPTFNAPRDLAVLLAGRAEASECLSQQLFRFTFSRLETDADACAVQTVREALAQSHGDLSHALMAITTTDAFTWRADP